MEYSKPTNCKFQMESNNTPKANRTTSKQNTSTSALSSDF